MEASAISSTPVQAIPGPAPGVRFDRLSRIQANLPVVLIGVAVGTLLIAVGFAGSRAHDSWAAWPFWIGWIVSTLLLGLAITSPTLSARGRVAVVLIEAAQQSFVRWMYSPLSFTFPDELSHWRTAVDILNFHHLYHENPRLHVSPVFPGLEEVATSLVSLTHIGLFAAGTIVVATSHIALSAATFYLFRRVSGSARIGGMAAFVFAMNPLHAGFDSMFIYQAPALLLGTVALETALDERAPRTGRGRVSIAPALICLAGLVVTHHLTAAVFILAFAGVGILIAILAGFGATAKRLLALALAGVLMATIWVIAEAGGALSYLGTPLGNTISGVIHFGSNAGTVALPASSQGNSGDWLTILATIVTAILVAVGFWILWRRPWGGPGRSVLARTFALFALSYYGVLLIRQFAPDGAELSGRLLVFAALFTSVSIGFALVDGLPVRERLRRHGRPAAVAALLVIFLGAKMSGWPAPWEQLPGDFHAAAFESGIDRANTEAVKWFGANIGPGHKVVCDTSTCALAVAYAEADPVPNEGELYYSPTMTSELLKTIHGRGLEYLIVDDRLSQEKPISGHFFHSNSDEAGSEDGAVPEAGLAKFKGVPGIMLIYDNGPIQIYDLRGVPLE
jgi:hypothetical protein